MMKYVATNKVAAPIGPFSLGVRMGNFLFTCGQGGTDPATGRVVSKDIRKQTAKTMENLREILRAEDMDFSDVLKVNVYLTNLDDYEEMNEVYASYMGDHRPARSCVEVSRLPIQERVKMEMIACKAD